MVYKLHKSLYDLKQSGRQWFTKLTQYLTSLGYIQSHHDHSLFTKKQGSHFTALLIYVYDLVLAGNDNIEIQHVKHTLDQQFKIKDFGFLASKPAPTPIVKTTKLHNDDNLPYDNPASYRRLVGGLLYLTNTRPDISFAIQQLSQFMAQPTVVHFRALTRILRYVKANPEQGMLYPNSSSLQLKAFSDSDWASCMDSMKSISGCCVFLEDSLVSWKSKK
ncbi:PREDICTED: uncharacterized protein LOC109330811 [Lupinus angustifolius]|uniref:uncharacterized protein LOC109330811 n=1 Tax=Lupinus angustifolius TaxID=3871 RepID=UPI00092F4907|nr:PREDICTED: uncharacterized protein LOC109330811 [Lupinus angustifolius]